MNGGIMNELIMNYKGDRCYKLNLLYNFPIHNL